VGKLKIYGLLISAGLSGRMGKFKPLLEYEGKSFVENIAGKLCTVCEKVIVVTGFNSAKIDKYLKERMKPAELKKIRIVHNANYKAGMFTSLKTGLLNCSGTDWVLYQFVDQPTLPLRFYFDFINQIENGYDWIQPVSGKRKGHPVLFDKKVIEKVSVSPDDSNLREISHDGINKKYWECEYKEIFDDIDRIEDYKNLT